MWSDEWVDGPETWEVTLKYPDLFDAAIIWCKINVPKGSWREFGIFDPKDDYKILVARFSFSRNIDAVAFKFAGF